MISLRTLNFKVFVSLEIVDFLKPFIYKLLLVVKSFVLLIKTFVSKQSLTNLNICETNLNKNNMNFNLHFHWRNKISLFALFCLMSIGVSHAQSQSISGSVTTDGQPLPGVTVVVKGTSVGAVTDFDGGYFIKASANDVLVFSYVGYETKQVTVGNDTTIDVALAEDVATLDEVVVVGYGTQKRRNVQGAIESVKAETIEKIGTSDLASALQGQIAGVNVTASSGQPGANAVILIRGINSVFGSNEPLYVVDGIVQQDNPQLSPNEIETIDVIKDAASAAVYGTRGSNGVILITTKRGKVGKMSVTLNSYYGQQKIVSGVPLLDTEGILYVDNRRSNNINPDAFWDNTFSSLELNPYGLTNNTDITDIVQNDYAPIQNHNINVSGGKEGLIFNLNANYFDQEGTIINSGMERFNIRANTTYEKGIFKLTTGINLITDKQQLAPYNLLLRAYSYRPYNSNVSTNPGDVTNIGASPDNNDAVNLGQFAKILKQTNYRENDDYNFNIRGDFKIFDGFTFTSRANFGRRNTLQTIIDPFFQILTDDGEQVIVNPRSGTRVSNRRRKTFLFENYFTYDKFFGNHHVTATGLFSAEEATTTYFQADGRDFLNDVVTNLGGTTADSNVDGNEFSNSLVGIMGRLQYDYKGKYLVSALIRMDASSRFPEKNRYVPLPSASAAWIVSEENSWKNIMGDTFNFLKFRFSYGTVGNQFLGDYVFQPTIAIDRDAIFGSGKNESLSLGQIQDAFANTDVKWERKVETNFGVEMGFFNNKLSVTTDIYEGTREDMLFNVLIPPSVGSQAGNVTLNIGDMRNYGYELGANYRHVAGDFNMNIGATYSQNNNLITSMSATNTFQLLNSEIAPGLGGGSNNDPTTAIREGYEAGAFFLYETEGLVTNDDELVEYRNRFDQAQNAQLGALRFVDQLTEDTDGDGIADAGNGSLGVEDRVYKGSGAPEYEIGFNMNFGYKGFDLSMQWYGAFGGEIMNGSKSYALRAGTHRDLLNAWSAQNPTATIPADRGRDTESYRGYSDYFLEDGTFIRLRNVQLGYTFPSKWTKNVGMSKARIYLAADNPLTFTKYTGFDPEAGAFDQFNQNSNGINRRGIDSGNYPIVSQMRVGVQINF